MFIKEIKKKNKGYEKSFIYHRLMESYRTPKGPRQRTILNLGQLDLPKEKWKVLADRIEEIIYGQTSLLPVGDTIEQLANHYASIIEIGFPKASKIFRGNQYEAHTLIDMIQALQDNEIISTPNEPCTEQVEIERKGITVVIDAGISTKENLELLKHHGYDYICVSRTKPKDYSEVQKDGLITIKQDAYNKIEAQLITQKGERILYCKSALRAKKELSMKNLFQSRFEDGMQTIASSLNKKGGTKMYAKVLQRIGRLKEKYASIAQYYTIEVKQKSGIATSITWNFEKQEQAEEAYSGAYFIRTSRSDLDEKEIWSLYIMLTNVESAFKALKTELSLRPIFHQKEKRSDAHIFITLIAYHLLNSIQTRLRRKKIHMQWQRVRKFLSSHVRITTSMTTREGVRIFIRNSSNPEPFHKALYTALDLNHFPLKSIRTRL